ncbi:MAG: class I SAM-dependent methyltransferase [Bdellovibrionaceae bacterium]|nr:class I SAM-dependent methyltransferase [Pseudobdellovibrionaceae bacterium]
MDRVTSDLIAQFHQDFPQPWRFPDLMRRAKEEAARTEVGFMSLGEAEMAMFAQALKLTGAHLKPAKWVEVGALTGYSALCLLSTLAEGSEVWTIEKSPDRCRFLKELFAAPELSGRLHLVEGDSRAAKATLESLGPFDGIFLDGAKAEYQNDLDWAEKNLRSGALVVADNVFLRGAVFQPDAQQEGDDRFSAKQVQVMRGYLARVMTPARYETFMIPSSDGMAVSRKLF